MTIRSVPPPAPPARRDRLRIDRHPYPPVRDRERLRAAPNRDCRLDWSVVGLIRVTVPSPLLATHTDPAPTATPAGDSPTGIVSVTARVSGSIRTSRVVERVDDPHAARRPPRSPVGPLPTAIGVTTPVGSTRTTLLASLSVSHTAPSRSTAIPDGLALGSTAALATVPVVGVRARQQPARRRNPDRVALGRDRTGAAGDDVADPHCRPRDIELGVDPRRPRHCSLGRPPDPAFDSSTHTAPAARREARWRTAKRDSAHRPQGARVDARDRSDRRGSRPTATRSRTRRRRAGPHRHRRRPRGRCPCRSPPASWAAPHRARVQSSASSTATAAIAPSSTAPPAAINTPPRLCAERCRREPRAAVRPVRSSAGSWARIARSSS